MAVRMGKSTRRRIAEWDGIVNDHAIQSDAELGQTKMFYIHYTSKGAKQINVYKEPWCHLRWGKIQADRYLSPAPKGAFIVRKGPQQGEFVLSVQSGIRVCHVLLRAVKYRTGPVLYNIYPTPQWFESLYDLVLFCSYQPFYFSKLDATNEITLSLAASSKAQKLNRALQVKNASATQAPIDKNDNDDEDGEEETTSAPLMFYGFMTKQGRVRKTWKYRYFELTATGRLVYYKVMGSRKEQGCINLDKDCESIRPGHECPVTWNPQANPNYCFGIFAGERQLYVYTDTKDELQGWLQALARALGDKIAVPTPDAIRAGAAPRQHGQPEEEVERTIRINVFRNGSSQASTDMELPKDDMDSLKAALSSKLGFPVLRVFNTVGGEHLDIDTLRDDDIVFVAGNEPFIGSVTTFNADQALATAAAAGYDRLPAQPAQTDGYQDVSPLNTSATTPDGYLDVKPKPGQQGYLDVKPKPGEPGYLDVASQANADSTNRSGADGSYIAVDASAAHSKDYVEVEEDVDATHGYVDVTSEAQDKGYVAVNADEDAGSEDEAEKGYTATEDFNHVAFDAGNAAGYMELEIPHTAGSDAAVADPSHQDDETANLQAAPANQIADVQAVTS